MDVRIVEQPEFPPGCCFLSRTSTGPFVDTGFDIDDLDPHGRIYLAESTISDFAQHLGFTPPAASARARARIAELEARVAGCEAVVEGLRAANEALAAANALTPHHDDPSEPLPTVPAGSVTDVLLWVADNEDYALVVERARAARDAELLEPAPRRTLLVELDQYLLRKEEPNDHRRRKTQVQSS